MSLARLITTTNMKNNKLPLRTHMLELYITHEAILGLHILEKCHACFATVSKHEI